MEEDFQQWQNLWQQQAAKPIDTKGLVAFLNKSIRKTRRERWGMGISFFFTAAFLIYMGFQYGSITTYIGLGMIIFAMAFIFTVAMRRQLPITKREEQLANRDFLTISIQYLEDQMSLTSTYMWWYAVLLIVGINIAQINTVQALGFSMIINLGLHLGFSLFMFLLFYVSIKKREKQHQDNLQVKLETLRKLLQQLDKNGN